MNETLADRLRSLRKARDLTQEQLAVAAKLSASTVTRVERGKIDPDLDTVEALARALGVTAVELLGGGSVDAEAQATAYPSLQRFLEEYQHATDNERQWLSSHRFPDGRDIGDSDWWMAQLILYRQQVRATAASRMLVTAGSERAK